jgi:hypothetical protein
MRDMDQHLAHELLTDAMVMLRDIERNRAMPPTAQNTSSVRRPWQTHC